MNLFFYQLKEAWGNLKQKPGFVTSVVTTMGLTLGALLCVVTLAFVMLIKPLPYSDQEKLYRVEHTLINALGENSYSAFTYPGLIHLYKNQTIFSEVAMISYGEDLLTSLPHQPKLTTAYITPEWLNLLNTPMQLGRRFEKSEGLEQHQPVAVISYQTWQKQFAGDVDILQKTVTFSGVNHRIIGVLSESFIEPEIYNTGLKTAIWLPWDYNLSTYARELWFNIDPTLVFVGKLKDNITTTQAEQTISPLINDIWQSKNANIELYKGWQIKMELNTFKNVILGDSKDIVYLLLAGVIGLLAIACANIANLYMSRTAQQQPQLAIHAALGAKKQQLFFKLFAESALLMSASILLALCVATGGFWLLQKYLTELLPRIAELSINVFTLICALSLILCFASFFAAIGSKVINYQALHSVFQSGGKNTGAQVSKKVRHGLIISQVAVATALIFININLFKQASDTIGKPLGFDFTNIDYLSLSASTSSTPSDEETSVIMAQLQIALAQLPQVESVSQSASPFNRFYAPEVTIVSSNEKLRIENRSVDHQYFKMIRQPLLAGNYFSKSDISDNNSVIIINDVLAKKLSPQGNALGLKLSSRGKVFTVTGIVKGVKMPKQDKIPLRYYQPALSNSSKFLIKFKNNQALSREKLTTLLNTTSKLYAIYDLTPLTEQVQLQLFSQITTAITAAVLALFTFFLAGIGLYGILSYSTQIRRFEIGTRMAIGAKRKELILLILKENAPSILFGIATSIIVLLVLTLGFNEQFNSYLTLQLLPIFLVTLGLVSLISFCACYLPLRQYINRPAIYSLRGDR